MAAIITRVSKGSIADEMGIEAGDCLISMAGLPVEDILDYQFASQDDEIIVEVKKKNGELWELDIEKSPDEELGLFFSETFFDRLKTCRNKCVFCFIDQLPSHMRSDLYTKDDDYRLSFLFGNFITLTNMEEPDWQKLLRLRLSPLYISVHCLDPELRMKMMNNKKASGIRDDLQRLSDAGIKMHTQIVLCPGINDGQVLEETIEELALLPGVSTIGVVPVGLTGHRKRLENISPIDGVFSRQLIKRVYGWQERFRKAGKSGLVYLADEFFVNAGEEFPPAGYYDDFEQTENGIGLARILLDEFAAAEAKLPAAVPESAACILAGESACPVLRTIADRLNVISGLQVSVLSVANKFFGGQVTVTGLITGQDIIRQLKKSNKHKKYILHDVVLKEKKGVFLDDVSIKDIESQCGVEIRLADGTIKGLLRELLDVRETQPV
ncbi:MAG: DUF512 domain-containing protein [Syntrophomonadaceae bacterium]|jgi:putative radical SAM enzyme (TIGR03279 family)|nr:DUF512 domain-containing protein [Syntrophomonadaceae bacterium]